MRKNKLYYWARTEPGAASEVDYVLTKDGTILAVEVKAGEKGSLKSLHFLLQKYHQIEQAIVFSKSQSGNIEKIKFVPLYKVGVI